MEQNYKGKTIQSVQRALDILELFKEKNQEFSLGEISAFLSLNKSTAHGLISTLHQNDYLKQNNNGKYKLGQALLGKAALAQNENLIYLREYIKPFLSKICEMFSATTTAFFYENNSLSLACQAVPKDSYYISVNFDDCMPLHCTASGKLLLAYQSEAKLKRYLSQTRRKAFTEYTITQKTALNKELELIRSQGYSYENREHQIDVACLAVPLHYQNAFYGTCSVTGTFYRIEKDKEKIVRQLQIIVQKVQHL